MRGYWQSWGVSFYAAGFICLNSPFCCDPLSIWIRTVPIAGGSADQMKKLEGVKSFFRISETWAQIQSCRLASISFSRLLTSCAELFVYYARNIEKCHEINYSQNVWLNPRNREIECKANTSFSEKVKENLFFFWEVLIFEKKEPPKSMYAWENVDDYKLLPKACRQIY